MRKSAFARVHGMRASGGIGDDFCATQFSRERTCFDPTHMCAISGHRGQIGNANVACREVLRNRDTDAEPSRVLAGMQLCRMSHEHGRISYRTMAFWQHTMLVIVPHRLGSARQHARAVAPGPQHDSRARSQHSTVVLRLHDHLFLMLLC